MSYDCIVGENIDPIDQTAKRDKLEDSGLEDIPAYTCASQEHCRILQDSSKDDPNGAACGRRYTCTRCKRYAHDFCLQKHGDQEFLCYQCFNSSVLGCLLKAPLYCVTGFLRNVVLPILLIEFFFLPMLFVEVLVKTPEYQQILFEYTHHGIELEGLVIRRWRVTYNTKNGTQTQHCCSIVYQYPGQTGIFRCDIRKRPCASNTQEWSRMSKGAKVKVLALEGYPQSGRVAHDIPRPLRPLFLLLLRFVFAVYLLAFMLFPSIMIWLQALKVEDRKWIAACVYALLGYQVIIVLFGRIIFKRLIEKQKRLLSNWSVKPSDITSSTIYSPGCMLHVGEDY